jgi:proteasome maturation protein
MEAPSIPLQTAAHDTFRNGLASLKEDVAITHPVEVIQRTSRQNAQTTKLQMMRNLYGVAVPAKIQIEQQILGRFQRLPGLPSSQLGLDSLTGALDEFGFESWIGLPNDAEQPPVDLHSQMEAKLGLGGAKPMARGLA